MTGTSQTNAILERAYMHLKNREWERSELFFKKAAMLDPELSEAYVGVFLSCIKCADITSSRPVIPPIKNFLMCDDKTEEKLHPLYDEICQNYTVEYFFTCDDIRELCTYGGESNPYLSRARALARARDGFSERWEKDEYIIKARALADPELLSELEDFFERTVAEYNRAIDLDIVSAANEEEENFEKNRIPDIEARYRGALEKKTLFENALKNAQRARSEERYKDAVKILRDYKGHPEANALYIDCLEKYSSYYWAFGRKFAFGVLLIYALVLIGSIGMTIGEFSYGESFWYIPHFMVCAFSVICLHARAMYEKLKYKNDRISVMPDKLLDTVLHTVLPLTTLVPVISSAIYSGSWDAFMDGFFAVSPAFVYFIVYYSLTRKLRIRRVKEPLMWVLGWSLFCVCAVDGFPLGFLFDFANEGIYYGEFSIYQHVLVPTAINGATLATAYFSRRRLETLPIYIFSESMAVQVFVYVIQITLGLWWTVFIYLPLGIGCVYAYMRLLGIDVLSRLAPDDAPETIPHQTAENNKKPTYCGFGFTESDN